MGAFTTEEFAQGWSDHIKANGDRVRSHLLHPKLKEYLGNLDGMVALDAGCGTGYSTTLLEGAEQVHAGDINAYLVHSAAKAIPNSCIFDACNLPYKSQSIDVLLSSMVMMSLNETEVIQAAREWQRVLRSGGRAIVAITHPLHRLKEYSGEDVYAWLAHYAQQEEVGTQTIKGQTLVEYTRPLSWYFTAFTSTGFTVNSFDEIVIKQYEGILPKYKRKVGCPIFALFELQKNNHTPKHI